LLRQVGAALSGHVRITDLVARLGGDGFAVLLPDTDAKAAQTVAEKLHEHLRTALDAHPGVGASIGLAVFDVMPRNVDELLAAADRLMYEAKANGKDAIRTAVQI
jgi:two-component system cell cycle response regulator